MSGPNARQGDWSGFCLSDGYSCHGRVEQVSLQENVPNLFLHLAVSFFHGFMYLQVSHNILLLRGGMQCGMTTLTTTLVEEWTGQEGVESQDGANRFDSFSGFLCPGGRFAFTNKSVHYHHRLDFCLSNGYSCHGHVEQVSLLENVPNLFLHLVVSFIHGFM